MPKHKPSPINKKNTKVSESKSRLARSSSKRQRLLFNMSILKILTNAFAQHISRRGWLSNHKHRNQCKLFTDEQLAPHCMCNYIWHFWALWSARAILREDFVIAAISHTFKSYARLTAVMCVSYVYYRQFNTVCWWHKPRSWWDACQKRHTAIICDSKLAIKETQRRRKRCIFIYVIWERKIIHLVVGL